MGGIFGGGGGGGGPTIVQQPAQTTQTTTLTPEQNKLVQAQTGLFQTEAPIQGALKTFIGQQIVDPRSIQASAERQGTTGPIQSSVGPLAGQLQALQTVPAEQRALVEAIKNLSGPVAGAEAGIATRLTNPISAPPLDIPSSANLFQQVNQDFPRSPDLVRPTTQDLPGILADQIDLFQNVVTPEFRSGGVRAGQPFTLDPGTGQTFGTSSRGEDLAGILTRRFSEGIMDAIAKESIGRGQLALGRGQLALGKGGLALDRGKLALGEGALDIDRGKLGLGRETLALAALPQAFQTALAGPSAEAGLAQQEQQVATQRALTPLQLAMMGLGGLPLFSPGAFPGGTTSVSNVPGQANVPSSGGGIGSTIGGGLAGALLTALLLS